MVQLRVTFPAIVRDPQVAVFVAQPGPQSTNLPDFSYDFSVMSCQYEEEVSYQAYADSPYARLDAWHEEWQMDARGRRDPPSNVTFPFDYDAAPLPLAPPNLASQPTHGVAPPPVAFAPLPVTPTPAAVPAAYPTPSAAQPAPASAVPAGSSTSNN